MKDRGVAIRYKKTQLHVVPWCGLAYALWSYFVENSRVQNKIKCSGRKKQGATTAGFSKGLPALLTEFTGRLVYF